MSGPPVLSGRPLAAVLLGWSLVSVIAKLLFTKQKPGLELFEDNYGAEGLSAIRPEARDQLQSFSGCIACGRCNVGEAERIRASGGEYPGLMQLVLASTRSMPDYDAAQRGFSHIPDEVLARKTRTCPARIPFVELADFVRGHGPQLNALPLGE